MRDEEKRSEELLSEVTELRRRVAELEAAAHGAESSGADTRHAGPSQGQLPAGLAGFTTIEDLLRGILNSSTLVSVVLTDLDQNVLFWNTGAENIFGYDASEMIGDKITKLYPHDAFTEESVERLREMVQLGTGAVHGKMHQIRKDGETVTVSLALSPMLGPEGQVQGIVGVGLDVTEETKQQEEILRLLDQVHRTQDAAIFSLAKLAETRDEETGLHLVRISAYCQVLCECLAGREKYAGFMTEEFVDNLVRSAVLHDIGKIAIPDAILLFTGKFGPEEYRIMEKHTLLGGKALEEALERSGEASFLTVGRDVAYHHHERWDGSGYPFGLKGEDIPLSARIVAVADVYDAMTTERRYKRAFSHEEACSIIVQESGEHFDPEIVGAFQQVDGEFRRLRAIVSE